MPTKYIAFDPGVTGTGYAVWDASGDIEHDFVVEHPCAAGILTPGDYRASLPDRVNQLRRQVFGVIREHQHVKMAAVEWPQFFHSGIGMTAASRGDLGKLYAAATTIIVEGMRECGDVTLVDVNAWKGQLPKHIVTKRICKILKCKSSAYKTHMWDAIGIGLYAFFGHWKEGNG